MIANLLGGLEIILNFQSLLAIILGIPLGMIVGATPGLSSNMALAIGVTLTFGVSPIIGIPFLMALYKSSTYGGSISAILLNIPGTPAAAATCLDGYKLTQKGQAGKALKIALYSSVMGDAFSDIVLILTAASLASVAMAFGPPEFAMLLLFSLSFTGSLAGKSMIKGLASILLGLLFATVGLDLMTAQPRFSFGIFELTSGFNFIVVLIAMFTMSEVFLAVEKKIIGPKVKEGQVKVTMKDPQNKVTLKDMKKIMRPVAVGSLIGTFMGIMPGIGGAAASFVGYGAAKNVSGHPDEYGEGSIEGVAAAEATNNAVCGANLVPLLGLGVPGNSAAAILGAALMIQGIAPGPTIFREHGPTLYAIFVAMLLANLFILFMAKPFINIAFKAVYVNDALLYPIILGFCFVGSFAIGNSMFDVLTLIVFGLFGYIMKKLSFPTAPFVIAFLLGPLTERAVRQSLVISRGDFGVFVAQPLRLTFLILTVVVIAFTAFSRLRVKKPSKA